MTNTSGYNGLTSKLEALEAIIEEHGADFLLIERQENFSWLLGGRGHIGLASVLACASVLVGEGRLHLVANSIEMGRLVDEQIIHSPAIQSHEFPWQDPQGKSAAIASIVGGKTLLTEERVEAQLLGLRTLLDSNEIDELSDIAHTTASIVERTCMGLKRGVDELAVAGLLAHRFWEHDLDPITTLIGFDDRARRYKHPVPVGGPLNEFALVAVCTRRKGLIASVTRMVSLKPIPDLEANQQKTGYLEALALSVTYAGNTLAAAFDAIVRGYGEVGESDEWKRHHQGGLTGYAAREIRADYSSVHTIREHEAYAWNPSIKGAKSESTVVVTRDGVRNLTQTGKYPYQRYQIGGKEYLSEGVLVLSD